MLMAEFVTAVKYKLPIKVCIIKQALRFAESLARGEPNRGKIALTALSDRVREMV